jgi:hypothetical protein
MRFVDPDLSIPTNYFVCFEASSVDRSALLCYLHYLAVERAYDRVVDDERFAPSAAWKRWASGTFVAFSGDQMMIKSGHRFIDSYEPIDYLPVNLSKLSVLRRIRTCIAKIRQMASLDSLDHHYCRFTEFHPRHRQLSQHYYLLEKHGFVYLRMLEVFNLIKLPQAPNKVVEIGAGACFNAYILKGEYNFKYTSVDLPETIPVGFAFLKAVFPSLRIALPNVVQERLNTGMEFDALWECFDVIFLLPYQSDVIDNDSMDCAFNVSSFQEMRIEVVNEYLSLLQRIGKRGGNLVSENLKISREIPGNSFDKYNLSGFACEMVCTPKYGNYVIRGLQGLEYLFYQGRKL